MPETQDISIEKPSSKTQLDPQPQIPTTPDISTNPKILPIQMLPQIRNSWLRTKGLPTEIQPLYLFVELLSKQEKMNKTGNPSYTKLIISILSNIIDCSKPDDFHVSLSNDGINALCRMINEQEMDTTYLIKDLSKILTYFFLEK